MGMNLLYLIINLCAARKWAGNGVINNFDITLGMKSKLINQRKNIVIVNYEE